MIKSDLPDRSSLKPPDTDVVEEIPATCHHTISFQPQLLTAGGELKNTNDDDDVHSIEAFSMTPIYVYGRAHSTRWKTCRIKLEKGLVGYNWKRAHSTRWKTRRIQRERNDFDLRNRYTRRGDDDRDERGHNVENKRQHRRNASTESDQ